MKTATTLFQLEQARQDVTAGGKSLGFVPTMGCLHEGHLSLVRRARQENACVAVSIFVNPAQFGPGEDFETYPRNLERDLDLLWAEGVDLVFTPTPDVLYPEGFATSIHVGGVAEQGEGASRPGHFDGVALVVTKLFNLIRPEHAYFGQKDAQQCAVIKQFVSDLNIPVQVVVVPTSREADGLARSSRNLRLTSEDRARAPALYCVLQEAARLFRNGERNPEILETTMRQTLQEAGLTRIDYTSILTPETFIPPDGKIPEKALALLAVRLGEVRLIDNIVLE